MVLCPIPWANRGKALPFLSILTPSERSNRAQGKVHKHLTDWTRQGILQICRWLPQRRLVFVGDSGFAVLDLLASVRPLLVTPPPHPTASGQAPSPCRRH